MKLCKFLIVCIIYNFKNVLPLTFFGVAFIISKYVYERETGIILHDSCFLKER
jgi:hypothetical protein